MSSQATKRCWACGQTKTLEAFYRDNSRQDGRTSSCKDCGLRRLRDRYLEKRVSIQEKARRGPRICRCGRQTISPKSPYCESCSHAAYEMRRGAKTRRRIEMSPAQVAAERQRDRLRGRDREARGYGHAHQKLRKVYAVQVEAGLVDCARCGRPLIPGEPWDLGHDDEDRRFYKGPEHRRCNRGARSHKLGLAHAEHRRW